MSSNTTVFARTRSALAVRARRAAARGRDSGASALEWAIIAAVVVVAASVIGGVVFNIVQSKGNDLQECANVAVGSACAGGVASGGTTR
ncbi:hypothetical protein [Kineococcus indalonis]|uniref:hypothetical protein n=1 Tax=Kineococcus indalonis TaxID=2696566 RepID=UPI001411D1A4|nr:hypothetical protein [Kineococcus indalonis]NAZ86946.1 hypothetical protein [Kineococcus indalonis]